MNINEAKNIFINETYANAPKRNFVTDKIDVFYTDNIWEYGFIRPEGLWSKKTKVRGIS